MIELICFDLDGVLVNTNALHVDAWKATFHHHGIKSDTAEAQLNNTIGLSPDKIIEYFFPITNQLKKEDIKNTKNLLFRRLITERGCELYPDANHLLNLLKNDGYPLALISTSSSANFVINHIGLDDVFDFIVSGNEVSKGKPAPDPYLKAISFFNSNITVAFEDTSTGVMSARSAGCYCIGIQRKKIKTDMGADNYLSTGFEIDSIYLENLVKEWLITKT